MKIAIFKSIALLGILICCCCGTTPALITSPTTKITPIYHTARPTYTFNPTDTRQPINTMTPTDLVDDTISFEPKGFHWISILDGNWGVTQSEPAKYIHMLQLAGYDKLFCASELITDNYEVRRDGNPLINYLINELDCEKLGK